MMHGQKKIIFSKTDITLHCGEVCTFRLFQ